MGGIRKTDGKSASCLDILSGPVAGAQAEDHLIGIVQSAPGSVHGIGSAVFIVGADDQHRQWIKPGFCPKILTHNTTSSLLYFCPSTSGTISTYR